MIGGISGIPRRESTSFDPGRMDSQARSEAEIASGRGDLELGG